MPAASDAKPARLAAAHGLADRRYQVPCARSLAGFASLAAGMTYAGWVAWRPWR